MGTGNWTLRMLGSLQEILTAVVSAQAAVGGEAAGAVSFEGLQEQLNLYRPVNLPELRRHKRAFLKLATQNNWLRVRDAEGARQMFVDYLQDNIQ
jgi:protein KTI12